MFDTAALSNKRRERHQSDKKIMARLVQNSNSFTPYMAIQVKRIKNTMFSRQPDKGMLGAQQPTKALS